jgi:hypothetical protein
MKKFVLIFILFFSVLPHLYSQTIVASYPFPRYAPYNSFYGITEVNDTLWIGTSNGGSLYKVTKTGNIVDSVTTEVTFNQGLAWDGSGFWVARNFGSQAWRFYKLNMNGQKMDSISIPSLLGESSLGLSGLSIEGTGMWFAVYSPDYTVYPFGYAFKIDLTTKQITDTIPLMGRQVLGITVKGVGDTIIYANDYFHTTPFVDPERIYIYSRSTGDTLMSFPTPDPDGDCQPRGLHWDGQYLWLVADRIGNNQFLFRTLYKYDLAGQGNPQIAAPPQLNFGNTVIGSPSTQVLGITNSGTANLILNSFTFSNPVFSISPNNLPDTIAAGQSKDYNVTFNPAVWGDVFDSLMIGSNDGVTPVKVVRLSGRGVHSGSFISSNVSQINYGERRTGSSSGGYITLINQGNSPLSITSFSFNTPTYVLDTVLMTFPINLQPQEEKGFRIWFRPTANPVVLDTAKINSNAGNNAQLKIALSGSGNSTLTALGDIMWTGNVPDNPFTGFDDYQTTSIKQIADVNNDGVNDVVISSGNYLVTCFNGASSGTGDILWSVNTGYNNQNTGSVNWEEALQIRTDVNGDGIEDVVFGCGGGNEHVYTVSGRTGQIIWSYGDSVNFSQGDINGIRVDKDYNGDGINDVLVSASGEANFTGRHSIICLDGLTGAVIFITQMPSNFTHDVVSTQSGGAIGTANNGGPYSVTGVNNAGQTIWSYGNVNSAVWNMREVPDISNNGIKDIIGMYGFNGGIFGITGDAGAQVWATSLGSSNNGRIILLDDLNGNGFIDFAYSGPQTLSRVDSKTGIPIWQQSMSASFIRGIDYLTDVNGDGVRDIVVAMQQPGKIVVVDGTNGATLFEYLFGPNISERGDRAAVLKSIDGNLSTEFVGGNRQGRVVCFSGGQNTVIGINPVSVVIPDVFYIDQNYPNPFNPVTNIKFGIPELSKVKLVIYDALGREIKTLVNNFIDAGAYEVQFDGSSFASGIYFYRIEAGSFVETKKLMLVK